MAPAAVRIVVDVQEARGGVPVLLEELGTEAELAALPAGDYAVGAHTIVERKRVGCSRPRSGAALPEGAQRRGFHLHAPLFGSDTTPAPGRTLPRLFAPSPGRTALKERLARGWRPP
jgi:hypothetical protein